MASYSSMNGLNITPNASQHAVRPLLGDANCPMRAKADFQLVSVFEEITFIHVVLRDVKVPLKGIQLEASQIKFGGTHSHGKFVI